jgi:hypothetical protein
MGIFDIFKKTSERETSNRIRKKLEERKNSKSVEWIDELRQICNEQEATEIVKYYNLVFTQLKVSVFTLLAPVNLKDEVKLKKFYTHKFSIGYLWGFLFSLLQIEDFMKDRDDQLIEIILPAMIRQLFNVTKESSKKIYQFTLNEVEKNESDTNDFFAKGVDAGNKDWEKFVEEDFKGMIGVNFSYYIDELKEDLN